MFESFESTILKIFPDVGDTYEVHLDGRLTEEEIREFLDDHCRLVSHYEVIEREDSRQPSDAKAITPERTLELLNKVIDQMIEDEGMKPKAVIEKLLDLDFTADELIELNFFADEVLDLAVAHQDKTSSLNDIIAQANQQKDAQAGKSKSNEYYKTSDGWFDYYVNTKTGERKLKLDKEDVCVERKADDLSR